MEFCSSVSARSCFSGIQIPGLLHELRAAEAQRKTIEMIEGLSAQVPQFAEEVTKIPPGRASPLLVRAAVLLVDFQEAMKWSARQGHHLALALEEMRAAPHGGRCPNGGGVCDEC